MKKYLNLLMSASALLLAGSLTGQPRGAGEIRVVSQLVGATIDIPEEEYYRLFGNLKGFRSAQFRETAGGFQARIRTEKGWITRSYTPREFYDLGLAVDLTGPMDPRVWAELSGQRAFDETVANIGEIPLGVRMMLFHKSGRLSRGVYQGFEGHHLYLKGRGRRVRQVPLEGLARIWYREGPVPDLMKDARIFAATALLGMLVADGWNRLFNIDDFDGRWRHRFTGGWLGLCGSPFVVHWFRVYRAPVHVVKIPRETRDKIGIYAFITFN